MEWKGKISAPPPWSLQATWEPSVVMGTSATQLFPENDVRSSATKLNAPFSTLKTSPGKIFSCLRLPSSCSAALVAKLMRCCSRRQTRLKDRDLLRRVTMQVKLTSKSSSGKAARARSNSAECAGKTKVQNSQIEKCLDDRMRLQAQDATAAHG